MARRFPRLLYVIWICFALRLVFYAAVYPMWEGLDEWGHMAYLDHLRQTGEAPTSQTPVSGEIAASFSLLPLAPHLPSYVGAGISHGEYWRLPPEERERRERAVHELRLELPTLPQTRAANYQAQHPPFAYWLLGALDSGLGFEELPSRVYALRMALVVIASLCLPLLWMLCRRVFASEELVAPACLVLAAMPNFAVYIARVSNDGIAVALMALAMVVFASNGWLRGALAGAAAAGVVAGAAALSKAYGILLIPVYGLAARAFKPSNWADGLRRFAVFLAVFVAAAGWWFVPTFLSTGTFSGEQLDVQAAAIPLAERLPNLFRVDWWEAWKYGSSSHIWIGGWSFLLLDEWIYWVFRAVGILAAAGLLRAGYRRWRHGPEKPPFTLPGFWTVPLPLFTLFVLAIAYQGWQIFNTQGASTAVGWYLSSVANAEAVVLVAGLGYAFGARHAAKLAAALTLALAALDLFTVNLLSLPYYAGLTSVTPGEMPILMASQWPEGGFWEVASRLSANHPAWLPAGALLTLWALYLGATVALAAIAIRLMADPEKRRAAR